ncbi:YibE/F family protein [Ruminococcus albus]|nr:YibE/F family protein [Ruminococcus albus]
MMPISTRKMIDMNLKDLLKKVGRKKAVTIFILFLICIGGVIFTENDYFLYDRTIAEVVSASEELTRSSPALINSKEYQYTQRLTVEIKNGVHKGKFAAVTNKYSSSLVTDEKYSKGDKLFVDVNGSGDTLKATCTGVKRDVYAVGVTMLFALTIVIVGGKKGALSLLSVTLNTLIFAAAIEFYHRGLDLFGLCLAAAFLFTAASLTIVSGVNKKTAAAVISALCGTAVTIAIAYTVLKLTKGRGVRFDQMQYLIKPYEEIFISELLVGGLGAIMDISITMSSSMSELIDRDSSITFSALRYSGREIGKDIMGTMTNVLLFTYVCGCIPLIILALRNNVTLTDVLNNYLDLEIVRAFVGGIGIVVTIPIAIFISTHMLKGTKKISPQPKEGDA